MRDVISERREKFSVSKECPDFDFPRNLGFVVFVNANFSAVRRTEKAKENVQKTNSACGESAYSSGFHVSRSSAIRTLKSFFDSC